MGFSGAYYAALRQRQSDKGIVDLHVTCRILYFDCFPGLRSTLLLFQSIPSAASSSRTNTYKRHINTITNGHPRSPFSQIGRHVSV